MSLPKTSAQSLMSKLDSDLLQGTLDVDEYASSILRAASLEKALEDYAALEQRYQALHSELAQLQSQAPLAAQSHSALPANSELSLLLARRFPTTSQLFEFIQPLVASAQIARDEDSEWYLNTFGPELDDVASSSEGRKLREQTAAFEAYEQTLLARLASATRQAEQAQAESARLGRLLEHAALKLSQRALRARVFASWAAYTKQQTWERQMEARGAQLRWTITLSSAFNAWRGFALDRAKARYCQRRAARAVGRLVLREWLRAAVRPRTQVGSAEQLAVLRAQAAKHKTPALMLAASQGLAEAVLGLINEGSAVNMSERGTGNTPLHASIGSEDICELLLENGANASAVNAQGETALHFACRRGDAAVGAALALLRHGADPNMNVAAQWPLHLAVDADAPKMVAVLVQYGARVDVMPPQGRTPVHVAAFRANVECLQALLPGVRPGAFAVDSQGRTPLHACAASQGPDCARAVALLLQRGFTVDCVDVMGQTPLHIFCQNPSATAECLGLFLGQAVDSLDLQDSRGNTALHYACMAHLRTIALLLVDQGASVYLANDELRTPLDVETQGFAAQLLLAIKHPPILPRAERASRDLKVCQVCRTALNVNIFGRRLADFCRRCGRLCCFACAVDRVLLTWNDGNPGEKGAVKVCFHCSEILKHSVIAGV